jgi:hypothetical protein
MICLLFSSIRRAPFGLINCKSTPPFCFRSNTTFGYNSPLTTNSGTVPKPHPSGLPDEYVVYAAYNSWYGGMPDPVPGDNSLGPFPWLCKFFVRYQDPNPPWSSFTMAMDVYIAQIEYEESDGE